MKEYIVRYETEQIENSEFFYGGKVECELVRCKDCKHRPRRLGEDEHEGLNLEFPDGKCPCQCEDPWYNWMPDDDWHCGNGERKE